MAELVNIPVEIRNELEQRMADAFLIYDFLGNKMVESIYVPKILRFLGCVPSERQTLEFTSICEFPDIRDYVHLSQFMKILTQWLLQEKMRPASSDELLNAFKVIDPCDRRYIAKDKIVKLFVENGEKFSKEELDEMLAASVDHQNGQLHYEPFVYKILVKSKNSIYELAKQLAATKTIKN